MLPDHLVHDAVFDNKYMKLFDARPNAIRTFGLRINLSSFSLLPTLIFQTFREHLHILCNILVYQITKACTGSDAYEERSHRCSYLSEAFHGNARQVP